MCPETMVAMPPKSGGQLVGSIEGWVGTCGVGVELMAPNRLSANRARKVHWLLAPPSFPLVRTIHICHSGSHHRHHHQHDVFSNAKTQPHKGRSSSHLQSRTHLCPTKDKETKQQYFNNHRFRIPFINSLPLAATHPTSGALSVPNSNPSHLHKCPKPRNRYSSRG